MGPLFICHSRTRGVGLDFGGVLPIVIVANEDIGGAQQPADERP